MHLLLALILVLSPLSHAQDTTHAARLPATPQPAATNAPVPAPSDEEVITAQGIKIWKKGKPKKAYRTLGFDRLEKQKGFPAAENKIARGGARPQRQRRHHQYNPKLHAGKLRPQYSRRKPRRN